MDVQEAAEALEDGLPPGWWTETEGPKIYAYPGDERGPRFSATVNSVAFDGGWGVTVHAGKPGFHMPVDNDRVDGIGDVARFIGRVVGREPADA